MIDDNMVVFTSHGNMTLKQARAFEQELKMQQPEKPPVKIGKNCPFREGIDTSCELEKCALFLEGCALSRIGGKPEIDTRGKKCPLNVYRQPCRSDCALYKNGCSLVAAINEKGE